MPYCEHCGNEIGYLPFNCNYCGGTFCKQHRLPENHECSFELKHKPAVPTSSRKMRKSAQEIPHPISQDYSYKSSRQLKKYIKRQEKERKKTRRLSQQRIRSPITSWKTGNFTLLIMLLIIIFSLIEIIRIYFFYALDYNMQFTQYPITLNPYQTIAIYVWRIISSPFVYTQSLLGFFILFIMVYFLRFMGQLIEAQYGTKYLFKFYFLCVGFHWGFHALLTIPFVLFLPTYQQFSIFIPSASASAAILGLISLLLFPMLNREVTGFMYFFPIRTKGKTFLIIIILVIMLPALFGLFYPFPVSLYSFVLTIPQLGGVLAAYLVAYQKIKLKK